MDNKIHLADTRERIRKKYRVKDITVKQKQYKKNEVKSSYLAVPQKSSAEKAKQSENYSTYYKAHTKNTVKNDETRSHYSEEDNSAEKEKYRKQMQYTAYQQKAAEMSKKLSSDIQVNVEKSKRQAAVSAYRREAPSPPKYSDKTKEAAAMLANRLEGDILYNTHKAAESNAPSKKLQNSPMGNSVLPKSHRVVFYLNSNQKGKARLTKPNSEAIRRFRRAAENTDKGYLKFDRDIGNQYHKMYKYQEAQRKLKKQEAKSHTNTVEKTEEALYVGGKIVNAANKDTVAEATAAFAAVPAELVAEKLIEKTVQKYSSIGQLEKVAGTVANLSASIDSQNSIGSAASSAVIAVPKYYITQTAGETVKKAAADHYKNKLEKKREALRNKQQKVAQRAENLKKEQAKRQLKINVYKSEHGITSNGNSALQNLKAVFKSQQNAAKAAAITKSSATLLAAASGTIIPIICIIVVIIIIIIIFSWMTPHTETLYDETMKSYVTMDVSTEREVLEGYIHHIRDYFDKKQLEILEVTELNFGGFDPDDYDYDSRLMPTNGVHLYTTKIYIDRKYEVKTSWSGGPNGEGAGSSVDTYTDNASFNLYNTTYYKASNNNFGLYEQCTVDDNYLFFTTTMSCDMDLYENYSEEYIRNHDRDPAHYPMYTYSPSHIASGTDITDLIITKYDSAGNEVKSDLAMNFLIDVSDKGVISAAWRNSGLIEDIASEWENNVMNGVTRQVNIIENNIHAADEYTGYDPGDYGIRFLLDKNIWSLYEYGNKWIKLSNEIDFEAIIAMAATKKWQEIESDGFDSATYTFEITDNDLDECVDELYKFYYSYRVGACAGYDCHEVRTGEGVTYTCNRATTHRHLIGQVTNYTNYGIDYVLSRILVVPQRSNYATDADYNAAMSKYNTDCEIYQVYVDYIATVLGTHTLLEDYENDPAAQKRLIDLYAAEHGIKPEAPTNIRVDSIYGANPAHDNRIVATGGYVTQNTTTDLMAKISWDAVTSDNYSVTGYNVYVVKSSGYKTLLATTSNTSVDVVLSTCQYEHGRNPIIGGSPLPEEITFCSFGAHNPPYDIVVTAYNDTGESAYAVDDIYTIRLTSNDPMDYYIPYTGPTG